MKNKEEKIKALIIGARAVIFDKKAASYLFSRGFYGKPFGVRKPKPSEELTTPLELSLLEALYLCEKGVLELIKNNKTMTCEELLTYACMLSPLFKEHYIVYKDLREKGYIVRSGMKFGADFAVYEKGPGYEHAPYLVTVMKLTDNIDPIEIVSAGRVSHSVRKRLIIALVDPTNHTIRYIMFKWVKM
ncbi:MAG: tRNA-intron lyase [Thermoprotei archaeon]|nr:MAG: tRNA-intron lyase [Thermoprotei archaeon]